MRVCIVPEFPAGLMSGGTLVQAEETCEALAATGDGLTAELFNWSEYRSLPDLYHFVSIQPHFYPILELIRQIGRPYLLTLLSPNPAGGPRLWVSAARHFVKVKCLRRVELYRAIHGASAIIAITRSGADSLRTIFRLGTKTLHVVPHGVREGFFSCSPDAWKATFGPEPFVLCVGAIQRRKNQLLLVEACNRLRLPVVLLGPVLPGEKDYGYRVGVAVQQNEGFGGRWLRTLRNDHPLLLSAFAACRVFALLSCSETQPISVLQAMAARKPVLLLHAGYVAQPPFDRLRFVDNSEPSAVDRALQQEWNCGLPTQLPASSPGRT